MKRTSGHSALETLVRLFLFNVETSVEDTRRAFGSMKLDSWVEAGAITVDGNRVIPAIKILLFKGLFVVVESASTAHVRRPDFVFGVTDSNMALAELMIPRPAKRMLDLGTGCGIQALLASAFCGRVHATDANPRAVMFARFNARLNGLANVSVVQGDLFEPVRELSFDLITSNPRYMVSPVSGQLDHDSGMQGDAFVQQIIRQAPEFLEAGGFCQLTCHWAHVRGQRWQDRVTRWFDETGCDAWAIRRFTQTPSGFAKSWCNRSDDPKKAADHYKRWMAHDEHEAIEAISTGLITMRRRAGGANWIRLDDWTAKLGRGAGDDVLQGFEAQDFLEQTRDDAMLLRTRVCVAPRARLEQRHKPSGGSWRCEQARLSRVGGLACSSLVDRSVLELLGRCDGTRCLGDVLSELAASLPGESRSISSGYLQAVRRLIARGILLPGALDTPNRGRAEAAAGPKVMILMRGLPSCGKTTAARQIAAKGGVHLEFDEYFYTQVGGNPDRYDWSANLMSKAHRWYIERVNRAVEAGATPIIVDSDNVPGSFTRQYVSHAKDRGYEIRFREPESVWWQAIRELLKDKKANDATLRMWAQALTQMSKTTHRVPLKDVLHRMNRWEEATVERILAVS